jgi:putative glutathione S-transferase
MMASPIAANIFAAKVKTHRSSNLPSQFRSRDAIMPAARGDHDGRLVDGEWQDVWYDTEATKGRFKRSESRFPQLDHRRWLCRPSGTGGFKAEPGRYHLYVSYACPWAHRTLIFRTLKQLEELISISVVDYVMLENGWEFKRGSGSTGDALFASDFLYEVYLKADPDYSGRVTVPVLWDRQQQTIVSNESAEIIRMLNTAFGDLTARPTIITRRTCARRSMR